ncbi:MAG: MBL fold metallo-hydrolase [Oscillospiraceae bacterium]|nr:MBL fold metallo-hydrolase [Ruminococcus sp.]MDE6708499.1 MBL fold metallo-hydrolase [Oscillospiraceae bacterium]
MKKIFISLAFSLGLLLTGCAKTTAINPANSVPIENYQPTENYNLTLCCMKLGKADGMVIQTENHTVVIDCGEKSDGSKMRRCLTALGVETIDYMILTHYDQDHIGGASKVIKYFDVAHVLAPDYEHNNSNEFQKLSETMQEKNLDFEFITEDTAILLDDAEFDIYPCQANSYKEGDDNNYSLITKLYHHDNIFLFTADAMYERLQEIMNIGDCTFLKEPYHGRELANLSNFLDAVTPEYAVISTSEEYLADSTLEELEKRNIQTYITYQDGNMQFLSDGTTLQVTTGIEYPKLNSDSDDEELENSADSLN